MPPTDSLPALLGGPPACPEGPPDWPFPDPAVLDALRRAWQDGSWGKYQADHVQRLQRRLAEVCGVAHVLACGSGTFAVELALRALKVGPGDEVILSAYDYFGNFLSVHAVGAVPVLIDVDPGNWNLSPERLAGAFGPATKAVLVSHLHGGLVPMREVMELAGAHGVAVVEDAAQAPGAVVQGRPAGSWGDAGVLSFGGSKLLTAGRGGALLTRRADVHQRARLHLLRGGNPIAPLSEMQAAALLPQLDQLAGRNAVRRDSVAWLAGRLRHLPGLEPLHNRVEVSEPVYYKFGLRLDEQAFGLSRDRFVAALRAEGVAADEGFRALHVGRSPGRFRRGGDLAEAERAHAGMVVLHHPVLLGPAGRLEQVARAVEKVQAHDWGSEEPSNPGAMS
jgi:dTDP-4-amino-4,6-dideoxygalactose transaminase